MLEIGVKVKTSADGNLRKVPSIVNVSTLQAMRQAMEFLRSDIVKNRLSKPRTGPWSRSTKFKGRWVRSGRGGQSQWVRASRRKRESGPPQPPQVLSVDSGFGRRSIFGETKQEGDHVVGRVGTLGDKLGGGAFTNYMAIHELRTLSRSMSHASWLNRSWLRPSVRDNWERVVKFFTNRINLDFSKLASAATKRAFK